MTKGGRKFWGLITVAFLLTGILAGLGWPVPPVKAQEFAMPSLPPAPEERLSAPPECSS